MLKKVEAFTTEPELLLDDDEIIPKFPSIDDSIFYNAVMNIRHHDRIDILFRIISTAMRAFARCIKKQLIDVLEGKYSQPASTSDLKWTQGTGLHNLTSERNFGSLDASQKRWRHATLHFHSSYLLLKSNRTKLISWIFSKPSKDRSMLMTKAKIQGKWLWAKHKREEADQKKKEETELEIVEAEAKRKAAKKLLKKAQVFTSITKSKNRSTSTPIAKITKSKAKCRRVALPQPPEVVKFVKVSDWVAVAFDNGVWYPGRVTSLDTPGSPKVDCIHPQHPLFTKYQVLKMKAMLTCSSSSVYLRKLHFRLLVDGSSSSLTGRKLRRNSKLMKDSICSRFPYLPHIPFLHVVTFRSLKYMYNLCFQPYYGNVNTFLLSSHLGF